MVRRRSRLPKLPRARPVQIMSGVCVWGNYGTTVTDCGRWLARPWGGVLQWDRWRAVYDKTDLLARELHFLPKLGRTAPGG
ncbi:hypothetical protein QR685DRAFT_593416 [Neurospora intermedia]|uniref:Uncharacterized protein n=1 Tax=Neurospora intermedia TaxID=5142 RepID=A0ABR3DPS4_NEUIN